MRTRARAELVARCFIIEIIPERRRCSMGVSTMRELWLWVRGEVPGDALYLREASLDRALNNNSAVSFHYVSRSRGSVSLLVLFFDRKWLEFFPLLKSIRGKIDYFQETMREVNCECCLTIPRHCSTDFFLIFCDKVVTTFYNTVAIRFITFYYKHNLLIPEIYHVIEYVNVHNDLIEIY